MASDTTPPFDGEDHAAHVERAIELAREAGRRGDGPFGTVLVRDDAVVMEASNRERTDDDLALHPELTLARRADRELSAAERAETTMYTSTEPCPMCAAGVAYAGLGGVVYSVSGARLGDLRDGAAGIPCEEVCERLGRPVPVHGPVLAEEGLAVHREFGPAGED
jgi:tRNA(Arg) A34 adenosine deaminase TadA